MRRREFIGLVGGAAAWRLEAGAQQSAMPVVGFLSANTPQNADVLTIVRALKQAGYTEGQNVKFEFRGARGDEALLPGMAAEFVQRGVTVIVTEGGYGSAFAAKAATLTIPIVATGGGDLVSAGLVASLNRPGGNITGISYLHNELASKRLDLLCKLVPQIKKIAYLTYPAVNERGKAEHAEVLAAAHTLRRELVILPCSSLAAIDSAFEIMAERDLQALLVAAFPIAAVNFQKVLGHVARLRLPAIYAQTFYASRGGLMSYSANGRELLIAAAQYVVRILKGEKPADLPIQLPTTFDFIINLKTATALNLVVPPTLLVAATQVIE